MQIGAVFPQTETSPDPAAIRDFAQAVEGLGYNHLVSYDHVLGGHPDRPAKMRGPYTHADPFHEVFVLFGYLAGVTRRIELATGILILPQRQTALVAKQAAEVDVLSTGRLRLGVGLGWNHVEYEALGMDFHNRGRRLEEQVELMLRLWTEPVVDFTGEWHRVDHAGINPLSGRRIPVWMGGTADQALRRVARVADGWMINSGHRDIFDAPEKVRGYVREAGRDPDAFGIEVRVSIGDSVDSAIDEVQRWRELGLTHVSMQTMGQERHWPDGHLDTLRQFSEEIGLS